MCRWEILELATGAPTIYGSSLPANTTGPQVLSLQQAPLQPAFPAPSHPTFLKTHLSQSLLKFTTWHEHSSTQAAVDVFPLCYFAGIVRIDCWHISFKDTH